MARENKEIFEDLRKIISALKVEQTGISSLPLRYRTEKFLPLLYTSMKTLLVGMPKANVPPVEDPSLRGVIEVCIELLELAFPNQARTPDELEDFRRMPLKKLDEEYDTLKAKIERDISALNNEPTIDKVGSLAEAIERQKNSPICDRTGCEEKPVKIVGYEFKALGAGWSDKTIGAVSVSACEEHAQEVKDPTQFVPDEVWHKLMQEYREFGVTPDRASLTWVEHVL